MECGLLWVLRHHSAFHEDTFHMRPAGFGARPFRQSISAWTTKSCWIWHPPFQSFSHSPQASGLWPLSLQQRAWPSWQCGRADVSPEEEGFKLAQECPLDCVLVLAIAVLWGSISLEGGTALVRGAVEGQGCSVYGAGTALLVGIWARRGSWAWVTRRLDKDGHYSSEYHGPHAAEVSRSILKMLSHAHFLVHQALVSTMVH